MSKRSLLPILLILPLLLVACREDGPALHGRVDLAAHDSAAYTFHADGTLTGQDGARPISASTTIDGEIVLRIDSITGEILRWTYRTPRLLVRSKMEGTADLADSTPVPPVKFSTDRSGKPVGSDSLGIQVGGIGMMVHGDVRYMFLPAQILQRKEGDSWNETKLDTIYDGPLPGINRTTRQFTYDGVVDTLDGAFARIRSVSTIATDPIAPNDTSVTQISAMTTTNATHYYSIEDGLLRLLRSETSIGIRPFGADPSVPPGVRQTLRMEMTRTPRP